MLVTLTTDWGLKDHYVAELKARILSRLASVNFIDISHSVLRHNNIDAVYIFMNSYHHFPENTVHFIGVSSMTSHHAELLAIKKNGQYFVGLNDGFFSLLFEDAPVDMVRLEQAGDHFMQYDLIAVSHAVSHLLQGGNLYELGSRPSVFVESRMFHPVVEENVIRGKIIYVDAFGNVISNIRRELFEQQVGNRSFVIVTRSSEPLNHILNGLSPEQGSQSPGDLYAHFNSSGFLELAIFQGNASQLLGMHIDSTLRIEYK